MNDEYANIGRGPSKPVAPSHASNKALMRHMRRYVKDWWLKPSEEDKNDASRAFCPMLVAVCENGDIVPIVAAIAADEDQKEEFASNMRKLFEMWKVKRYAIVLESWIAVYNRKDAPGVDVENGHIPEHMRPVNRDDRKEVMTISVIGKDEEHEFYALELVRDWETGLVTNLAPFNVGSKGSGEPQMMMKGRFMSLLEPAPYEGNPALNPENIQKIGMLSIILEAPEFMRERYEQFGQDFDAVRAEGHAIKQRLDGAYHDLAQSPEERWPDLCKSLESILAEATEYARQMLSDIKERQAREQAH